MVDAHLSVYELAQIARSFFFPVVQSLRESNDPRLFPAAASFDLLDQILPALKQAGDAIPVTAGTPPNDSIKKLIAIILAQRDNGLIGIGASSLSVRGLPSVDELADASVSS